MRREYVGDLLSFSGMGAAGWMERPDQAVCYKGGEKTVEAGLKDRKETDYLPVFLSLIFT